MAITNQERVGTSLELLKVGLAPFVDREAMAAVKLNSVQIATVQRYADAPILSRKPIAERHGRFAWFVMMPQGPDMYRKWLFSLRIVGDMYSHD
jgi:hypothetical protein